MNVKTGYISSDQWEQKVVTIPIWIRVNEKHIDGLAQTSYQDSFYEPISSLLSYVFLIKKKYYVLFVSNNKNKQSWELCKVLLLVLIRKRNWNYNFTINDCTISRFRKEVGTKTKYHPKDADSFFVFGPHRTSALS